MNLIQLKNGEGGKELTGKRNGGVDGEDTGVAAVVAELPVGITGEDAAAVAAEEFETEFV